MNHLIPLHWVQRVGEAVCQGSLSTRNQCLHDPIGALPVRGQLGMALRGVIQPHQRTHSIGAVAATLVMIQFLSLMSLCSIKPGRAEGRLQPPCNERRVLRQRARASAVQDTRGHKHISRNPCLAPVQEVEGGEPGAGVKKYIVYRTQSVTPVTIWERGQEARACYYLGARARSACLLLSGSAGKKRVPVTIWERGQEARACYYLALCF